MIEIFRMNTVKHLEKSPRYTPRNQDVTQVVASEIEKEINQPRLLFSVGFIASV